MTPHKFLRFWQRRRGVHPSTLTRRDTGHPAFAQVFTAIDVETTGLRTAKDRVCEVGLVKFLGDGTFIDEFSTLVRCQGSSPKAREAHGIADTDLLAAPPPAQVWAEVAAFINGTTLVAHNLAFDLAFVRAEAKRAGVALPAVPALCTLVSARRHLDGRAFSLKTLHKTVTGTWRTDAHHALGDARAVRDLLLWMIRQAPSRMFVTTVPDAPTGFVAAVGGYTVRNRSSTSLRASIHALPRAAWPRHGSAEEIARYNVLLVDALADGHLTADDVKRLNGLLPDTGLTGPQVAEMHHNAWHRAFPDFVITPPGDRPPTRRRQMHRAAVALGLDVLALPLGGPTSPEAGTQSALLRGQRFGFIGDSATLVDLASRAHAHGAPQVKTLTRTVLWVACDDVDGDSKAHLRARSVGLPLVSTTAASTLLNTAIRHAAAADPEPQNALRPSAEWSQARDLAWRHTWRAQEHRKDPGPKRL